MSKKTAKPAEAPASEQPQTGGAYIRMPDGSLVKDDPDAAPQGDAEPAADAAAIKEQEA